MTHPQQHNPGSTGHDFNTRVSITKFIAENAPSESDDSIPTIGKKAEEIIANKLISLIRDRLLFGKYAESAYRLNLEENPKVAVVDIASWAQITTEQACKFVDLAIKFGLGENEDGLLVFNQDTVNRATNNLFAQIPKQSQPWTTFINAAPDSADLVAISA